MRRAEKRGFARRCFFPTGGAPRQHLVEESAHFTSNLWPQPDGPAQTGSCSSPEIAGKQNRAALVAFAEAQRILPSLGARLRLLVPIERFVDQ